MHVTAGTRRVAPAWLAQTPRRDATSLLVHNTCGDDDLVDVAGQVADEWSTVAWLDVSSDSGQVRNALAAAETPGEDGGHRRGPRPDRYGNIDIPRAKS